MSIKVEVGKVYINEFGSKVDIFYHDNISDRYIGRYITDGHLLCIYDKGGFSKMPGADNLIKEHKEPFKNTIEGWVGYEDYEAEKDRNSIADNLLKRTSASYIHNNKENVGEHWKKSMHVRITVEEIID
jgi:hypothetical protein